MLSLRVFTRAFAAGPLRIMVPRAKMQITHSRSSGPGGQNVNKVNTKVELRFNVRDADWLPDEVRTRLEEAQKNRINKEGELIVFASESRSQASNFQSALDKIQAMVDDACIPPKVPRGPSLARPLAGVGCAGASAARHELARVVRPRA
jgi:protein subunit release factor B